MFCAKHFALTLANIYSGSAVLCTILATTKNVNDGEIHSSLPIDLGERKEKEEKGMLWDHLTHRHNKYMPCTPYTSVLCPF